MIRNSIRAAASAFVFFQTAAAWAGSRPTLGEANHLGLLGVTTGSISISTENSDFDTEIALFNNMGDLIDFNDDFDFGQGSTLQSQIGPRMLPAGRYYIAICGYNAIFDSDWTVIPGAASGTLWARFDYQAGHTTDFRPLAAGEVRWYSFDIVSNPPFNLEVLLDLGPLTYEGNQLTLDPNPNSLPGHPALAIFSSSGSLIDEQDSNTPWTTGPLGAGTYFLTVAPSGASIGTPFTVAGWNDGDFPFEITGGDANSGEVQFRYQDNLVDEQYRLVRFEVLEQPSCTVSCPTGSFGEGELTYDASAGEPDITNGACMWPGDLTTPAVLGQTWCGSTRSQIFLGDLGWSAPQDFDFYEIIVPAAMDVEALLDSSVPAVLGIFDPASVSLNNCNPYHTTPIAWGRNYGCEGPVGTPTTTIQPGTYWTIVYPDLSNGGVLPDSLYTLDLFAAPAAPIQVGGIAPAHTPFTITTAGSNFDTEIALYDASGTLLDLNDDADGVLTSRLDLAGLPTGTYYLMAIGYNADFFDNFGVNVRAGGASSTAGGTLLIDFEGNPFVAAVGATRGFWYEFEIYDPTPCAADLNTDGILDFFDVQTFLSAFSAHDPLADFVSDGAFDFFDVQAFLQAFSAGCP